MKRQPTGLSKEVRGAPRVPPASPPASVPLFGSDYLWEGHRTFSPHQDLAEVCKRDAAERDDKDVDRLVGLGSSRYGAGGDPHIRTPHFRAVQFL